MPRSEEKKFSIVSEGEHTFEVYDIGEDTPTKKSCYRTWKLNTMEDGEINQVWQNMFPWDEVAILEAIGFKRDDNVGIDWERDSVIGRKFIGTVIHEPYNGKIYAKIKGAKKCEEGEEVPF